MDITVFVFIAVVYFIVTLNAARKSYRQNRKLRHVPHHRRFRLYR